jgi:hypothetical protein
VLGPGSIVAAPGAPAIDSAASVVNSASFIEVNIGLSPVLT